VQGTHTIFIARLRAFNDDAGCEMDGTGIASE